MMPPASFARVMPPPVLRSVTFPFTSDHELPFRSIPVAALPDAQFPMMREWLANEKIPSPVAPTAVTPRTVTHGAAIVTALLPVCAYRASSSA
jgi:hypothetical protein